MRENEIFLRAIKEEKPQLIRSPYEDAVKTLELTLRGEESIKKGGIPLRVP